MLASEVIKRYEAYCPSGAFHGGRCPWPTGRHPAKRHP